MRASAIPFMPPPSDKSVDVHASNAIHRGLAGRAVLYSPLSAGSGCVPSVSHYPRWYTEYVIKYTASDVSASEVFFYPSVSHLTKKCANDTEVAKVCCVKNPSRKPDKSTLLTILNTHDTEVAIGNTSSLRSLTYSNFYSQTMLNKKKRARNPLCKRPKKSRAKACNSLMRLRCNARWQQSKRPTKTPAQRNNKPASQSTSLAHSVLWFRFWERFNLFYE